MALNFDAQINVDVAPFIANIERAKASVASLEKQINDLNSKKVAVEASVSGAASKAETSAMGARKAASAAAMQSMAAEEQMAKRMAATRDDDAKVEWQAEMMRKSAMDARVKDHRTTSSLYEDSIALQRREGKIFSDSIKAQMLEREKMNKLHGQALAMNERRDAALAKSSGANVRNMARERYALYDVAAAYQQVAGMATAAIREMAGTAIAYERAFVNVERTTEFTSIKVGEAARVMKYALMEVASEIPVAFGKVSEIATIANQLGIAQGEVASFSKTVAQFATTTGMTAEATAMSFGRIGELLNVEQEVGPGEDAYAKLGSAIAFAGVKAVATETQITAVTKEIATTAKMAKFSTPEVIGLATALASVGIAPEAARGSIMRTFAGINEAVSKGGASLETYASIANMSAEEFSASWTKNGQVAFDGFVKGLQSMSNKGQNLDTVLRGIGLKNVRDIQTVQKLGDNYDVYAESIRNAKDAFAEGSYLTESYGKIQDTVAAKLELLKNNWDNFIAGLGESVVGDAFKLLLDGINTVLKAMTDMSRSPVGYWLGAIAIGVSSLVAIVGTLAGVMALGQAAFLAFGTAMESMAPSSAVAVAGMARVDGALVATSVTAGGATTALTGTRMAVIALGTAMKAAGWIAALAAAAAAVVAIGDAIYKAVDPMGAMISQAESLLGGFDGLQDAITSDTSSLNENAKAAGQTAEEYAKAHGIILIHTEATADNSKEVNDAIAAHNNVMKIVGEEPTYFTNSANAIGNQTIAIGSNTIAWMKNAIARSDVVKKVAKNQDAMDLLAKSGYNADKALAAVFTGKGETYFEGLKKKIEGQKWLFPGLFNDAWTNANMLLENLQVEMQGSYNETILLGLGAEDAAKKVADAFKVPVNTVKDLTKASKSTKDIVKTVVDYASQMIGIFKRIDDIKFSKQTGLDEIAGAWRSMKTAADEAAKSVQKAKESIASISADKGVLEYKLSVAVRYGDTKRAATLRAEIAKKTTELADANADLTKAQEGTNKSLTANTETGAANRAGMVSMLGNYQSYIQALMATGMKGTELEKTVTDLKAEFIAKGKEIGYNTKELDLFAGQFDQYAKAVHDTPRDVTIEFDATKSEAFNAVQEYLAKEHMLNVKIVYDKDGVANSAGAITPPTTTAGGKTATSTTSNPASGLKLPATSTTTKQPAATPVSKDPAGLATYLKVYNDLRAEMVSWNKKNWWDQALTKVAHGMVLDNAAKYIAKWEATNGLKYKPFDVKLAYANGGYVSGPGSSRSDSIPARLSNGEFVMNAASVRTYGLDFMNSLNQMKYGRMPVNAGSAAGSNGGTQVVYLSPDDRALLRAAIDRPVNLFTETGKIASSANAGNVLLAQRGTN